MQCKPCSSDQFCSVGSVVPMQEVNNSYINANLITFPDVHMSWIWVTLITAFCAVPVIIVIAVLWCIKRKSSEISTKFQDHVVNYIKFALFYFFSLRLKK